MGYLERAVSADEIIEYKAKTHWIVFLLPVLLIAAYGLGLIFVFFTWLYVISTDLGVTNKRVIGKWGFISRRTMEQRLDKVEGVQVHQGIFGRLLGYGTVIVTGTGGSGTPIPNIADPLAFRSAVNAAMDAKRHQPTLDASPHSPRSPADTANISNGGHLRDRLESLENLRRDGLLSEDEYASKRAEIIAQL